MKASWLSFVKWLVEFSLWGSTALQCAGSCARLPRRARARPTRSASATRPVLYAVGREKVREYAAGGGGDQPAAPRSRGRARRRLRRPAWRRRCSWSSTRAAPFLPGAVRPGARDRLRAPRARRPGVPLGAAGRRRRRDHDDAEVKDISERAGLRFDVFESVSVNQRGETICVGTWSNDHQRGGVMAARPRCTRAIRIELRGHPRPLRDRPLRGRLRRLQPDPHRRGVRGRGRPAGPDPARPVVDGAGRAGARREAAGDDPTQLCESLSVQFRGMGGWRGDRRQRHGQRRWPTALATVEARRRAG